MVMSWVFVMSSWLVRPRLVEGGIVGGNGGSGE